MGGYANPCRDEDCPLEGRHDAHEPMGPPVTAALKFVSPAYHAEVVERLTSENEKLRAVARKALVVLSGRRQWTDSVYDATVSDRDLRDLREALDALKLNASSPSSCPGPSDEAKEKR